MAPDHHFGLPTHINLLTHSARALDKLAGSFYSELHSSHLSQLSSNRPFPNNQVKHLPSSCQLPGGRHCDSHILQSKCHSHIFLAGVDEAVEIGNERGRQDTSDVGQGTQPWTVCDTSFLVSTTQPGMYFCHSKHREGANLMRTKHVSHKCKRKSKDVCLWLGS